MVRVILASTAAFGGGVLVGVYIGFWLMTRPEYAPPARLASHHPRDDDEPPFA